MKYLELTTDALTLRAGSETTFDGLSDDALLERISHAQALREMRLDLQDALSLTPGDDTALDYVTETHSDRLQLALCYKALQLYYLSIDEGEGSQSRAKAKEFAGRYNQIKATFCRMSGARVSSAQFMRIQR